MKYEVVGGLYVKNDEVICAFSSASKSTVLYDEKLNQCVLSYMLMIIHYDTLLSSKTRSKEDSLQTKNMGES